MIDIIRQGELTHVDEFPNLNDPNQVILTINIEPNYHFDEIRTIKINGVDVDYQVNGKSIHVIVFKSEIGDIVIDYIDIQKEREDKLSQIL